MNVTTTEKELWETIRAEVTATANREPSLASFFHSNILSHPGLSSAIAHNLAEQLGSAVVSSLALRQVFESALADDSTTTAKVCRDILAYFDRDPACDQYAMPVLYFKGFRALQAHRITHWLWHNGRRELARYLQGRIAEVFSVDIHPAAQIGSGILVDHATGLVIGETAVVSDDVSMLHSVTLGGTGCETGDRHPKIRRGVLIAAGAKILGNIEIGEGAKIGAGSLVLEPVKPHTSVAGVPAKVVGKTREPMAALEMDQRFIDNGASS